MWVFTPIDWEQILYHRVDWKEKYVRFIPEEMRILHALRGLDHDSEEIQAIITACENEEAYQAKKKLTYGPQGSRNAKRKW